MPCSAAIRRHVSLFFIVFGHNHARELRCFAPIKFTPPLPPVDRHRAGITRITTAPPPAPIAAVVVPRATARRLYHLLRLANHPGTLIRVVDLRRAPPSSASNSNANRARPSNSGGGDSNRRYHRIHLLAAELGTLSRSAVATPIAGEAARGRRQRRKFKSRGRRARDPTR